MNLKSRRRIQKTNSLLNNVKSLKNKYTTYERKNLSFKDNLKLKDKSTKESKLK